MLKKRGIHRNPKTILRIMEKYGLLAEIRRRRKWQQMGQLVPVDKEAAKPFRQLTKKMIGPVLLSAVIAKDCTYAQ